MKRVSTSHGFDADDLMQQPLHDALSAMGMAIAEAADATHLEETYIEMDPTEAVIKSFEVRRRRREKSVVADVQRILLSSSCHYAPRCFLAF